MRRQALTDEELRDVKANLRDPDYGLGYYKGADGDHGPSTELFGDILFDLFKPESAVDFGCGTGGTLAALARHGCKVQAFDASESAAPIMARRDQKLADEMIIADLSKPMVLPQKYDLAISTECFEHIPPEGSEQAVMTVVSAAPRAVVTACVPTGRNPLHLNERPFQFWIDLFAEKGMHINRDRTSVLRSIMRALKDHPPQGVPLVPSWYCSGYIGVFEVI